MTWTLRCLCAGMLALTAAAVVAEEHAVDDDGERREQTGNEPAAKDVTEKLIVYIPPSRGSTRTRTGGGTRGQNNLPVIAALAPDHVGLTTRASPTLGWFVSDAVSAPLELTLLRDDATDPVLEVVVASEAKPGFGEVSLSQWDIALEQGVVYQWSVALPADPDRRDLDVVASGAIERVAEAPELAAELGSGAPAHRVLARHGIWYDALAELGRGIASGDEGLRAERAALLEQVGLAEPAASERARAHAR